MVRPFSSTPRYLRRALRFVELVLLTAVACGRVEFDPAPFCALTAERAPYANSDLGGDGTSEETAYEICSAEQLDQIGQREGDWDKWFRIGADIDLTTLGRSVTMIGTEGVPFTGHLDGRQFTIRGLSLVQPSEDSIGLFRWVGDATLENLTLDEVEVVSGGRAGALFGVSSQASPRVSNVHVSGSVVGGGSTGGIAGDVYCDVECHISFIDVSSSASVQGTCVGGVVGEAYDTGSLEPIGSTLHRIRTEGMIVGRWSGGIVGCGLGVDVRESTSSAAVDGTSMAGGLVGYTVYSGRSTIADSSATGPITGLLAGGLIGELEGTVVRAMASGPVTCTSSYCGGLIGDALGDVTESYATGAVSGTDSVGGLAGYSDGEIRDCYATGDVTGRDEVGGLVGLYYFGLATNSYASGRVTGRDSVGALIGHAWAAGIQSGEYRDSFAHGAVSGSSTTGRVSSTIGWLEAPAVQSGLVSASGRCTNDAGPCTVFGTEVDLNANPTYFEAPPNAPLDRWDFGSVWSIEAGALPRLRRAP